MSMELIKFLYARGYCSSIWLLEENSLSNTGKIIFLLLKDIERIGACIKDSLTIMKSFDEMT